jgi:hypothetical protein
MKNLLPTDSVTLLLAKLVDSAPAKFEGDTLPLIQGASDAHQGEHLARKISADAERLCAPRVADAADDLADAFESLLDDEVIDPSTRTEALYHRRQALVHDLRALLDAVADAELAIDWHREPKL